MCCQCSKTRMSRGVCGENRAGVRDLLLVSPQLSVVSPQKKQPQNLSPQMDADQRGFLEDLCGPPTPLATKWFKCSKTRLTRAVIGGNRAGVRALLLVSPQLSVLSPQQKEHKKHQS